MRQALLFGAGLIGALLAQPSTALASMPTPRTIVGCVIQGVFTSDDGYVIRARGEGFRDYDLGRFEGRRIRVRGMLSPGDLLVVSGQPRMLGPCRMQR